MNIKSSYDAVYVYGGTHTENNDALEQFIRNIKRQKSLCIKLHTIINVNDKVLFQEQQSFIHTLVCVASHSNS